MKKLVLIDSNALVHRAFHALPPMNSAQGVMTNAVYGFAAILMKMIKEIRPDYIAATFDLAGPTFRHEEFADYKAHREKAPDELYQQIPIVKELLDKMGIPVFEKSGFEADDLIGSLAEISKKIEDLQTIIVTGDLDTLQLVEGDKVVVFTLRKGVTDTFIYNEHEVKNRYNLKPSQLVDYRGLKGDPSDNIPGVPGIGEKTASVLIKTFGSLNGLYEEISDPKKDKEKIRAPLSEKLIQKLLDNKDQAYFSRKLSEISRNVPIEFDLTQADWLNNLDKTGVEQVLKTYSLFSLIKRLPEIYTIDPIEESPEKKPAQLDLYSIGDKTFDEVIKEKDDIGGILGKLKGQTFAFIIASGYLVVVTESDSKTIVLPLAVIARYDSLRANLKTLMEDEKTIKYTHDLKDQAKILRRLGMHIEGVVFDSKLASYLINSDLKNYEIDRVYYAETGESLENNSKARVVAILDLRAKMMRRMESLGVTDVFQKIELPLSPVLAELELMGVKIDMKAISDLSIEITRELTGLEKEIYKQAGEEFNINSPQQLGHILFEVLQLKGKVRKTGKGSLSTAASELEKLEAEHPIIEQIMRYRELQKLNTTYIEPFPNLVNKVTGRLYTTLNQTGTTTGRLSSQEPNLQNIPVRTEMGHKFRKSFVADNGYKLLSCDYSQLELRVVAHISKDQKMIDAFKRGEDIHTRTASEIFGVKPEDVKDNMRRDAKTLNFGILYGMGQLGFQRAAGVTRERAKEFIQKYMEEFSGVARYIAQTKNKAHSDGFVSTIFGRRRPILDINSSMPQIVSQAERMAINMPIQGTAADMIKMAMVGVSDFLHHNHKEEDVRMLLQVHDELLFEVKEELLSQIEPKIREIMEGVYEMTVPIVVDSKVGNDWADMQKID